MKTISIALLLISIVFAVVPARAQYAWPTPQQQQQQFYQQQMLWEAQRQNAIQQQMLWEQQNQRAYQQLPAPQYQSPVNSFMQGFQQGYRGR